MASASKNKNGSKADKAKDQNAPGTPPKLDQKNDSPALPQGSVGLRKFDKFKTLGGSHNDK